MDNPFRPSESDPRILLITGVAAFLSLFVIAMIDKSYSDPYLIASFGATAVLIYGAPKAPFSQPKNVFFGHLFSAVIGVTVACIFDATGLYAEYCPVAIGIAVAASIIAMMLTGTVHPPGGATALTCVLNGFFGFEYVLRPVMLGVVLMMAIAYCANHAKSRCAETKEKGSQRGQTLRNESISCSHPSPYGRLTACTGADRGMSSGYGIQGAIRNQ